MHHIFCLAAIAATLGAAPLTRAADTAPLTLTDHPRLWVPKETLRDLPGKLHSPYLKESAARILADADWLVGAEPIAQSESRFNQAGTRAIASHLKTLTTAYVLTRQPKYRGAAIRHLANILTWRHISCEANRHTPPERKMFFCLSYGEHAADIALMYDIFRPDITDAERKVFDDVLDRFYLQQAERARRNPPWWVNTEWSNWNGVCSGGMGMLALAFYDDRPEARALIPFVEESLNHYFQSYIRNGGGNHEGTGYWNYGMHYAMRYLLSWENATGKRHPAFDIEELGRSLHFPVDFHRLSFGDNDGWHPSGMFFLVARRTNQPEAALRAAAHLLQPVPPPPPDDQRKRLAHTRHGDILYAADAIPEAETMRALQESRAESKVPLARVYDGLGWGILTDDTVFPALRLAVRGGSSKITGHGHLDLLSVKCSVNGQRMIEDQRGGVSKVNFTGRGHHLYSRSPAAKSTLLVDGLGCCANATCRTTEVVTADGLNGIRIDAAGVYMTRWRRPFMGRLCLMVDNACWLIVDTAPGHAMEARFHTYAAVETGERQARLTRGSEQLAITFASLGQSVLQQSAGMPAYPRKQTTILRWMTGYPRGHSLQVTALNPGPDHLQCNLAADNDGFTVHLTGGGRPERTIRLTRELKLRP